MCKKSASGEVQVLGLVHTQKLDVVGKALWSHVSRLSWEGEGVVLGLEGQRWLPSEPAGVLFSVTVFHQVQFLVAQATLGLPRLQLVVKSLPANAGDLRDPGLSPK